jgi:ribosomal protein S12 methylthiotransferase
VAFLTLGCAKNEVDSERMRAALSAAGFSLADSPDTADCLVINTCAFISEATEEAIATILEAAETPRVSEGRCKLVVAGCLPSRYGDELSAELPEVAAFVPVASEGGLADVIAGLFGEQDGGLGSAMPGGLGNATPGGLGAATPGGLGSAMPGGLGNATPGGPLSPPDASHPRRLPVEPLPWAYLKIAEGCSRRCSFCTIPDIRGPYRSEPLAEVIAEADQLVGAGARELVLIAQDTGLWRDGDMRLPDLLERLARRYPDVWLRVMYLEPAGVTDRLLEVMAAYANICDYLDIPLQHASPKVLAEMNRSGSSEEHLALLGRIRAALPGVTLRTTLIAGFPGETRAEAKLLERFVEAAQFDYVGVFAYSQEDGTPAGRRDDQVPRRTRLARAQRLRDLADAIGAVRAASREGSVVEALVCEYEDGVPIGRSQAQAPEVDGVLYLDAGQPGERNTVIIGESMMYDAMAMAVEEA